VLAQEAGCETDQVLTFASSTMNIVAVVLTANGRPVHLYHGSEAAPFDADQIATLALLGGSLKIFPGAPVPNSDAVVLGYTSVAQLGDAGVDGLIRPNVLFIADNSKISSADIFVIRKRMATPVTTPVAEAMLQTLANVAVTANTGEASRAAVDEFYAHLQTLCGTDVNTSANPVVFTAGLPALCSVWLSLIQRGGADVMMCSTAYGGSSQLTDLLQSKVPKFKKHTFDIQGLGANIVERINGRLEDLAAKPNELMPTTVVIIEIPTNPDMKVPDMKSVAEMLSAYKAKTGKNVVLLIDSTFAPGSKVMQKLKDHAPELTVMTWISLSKSVSRGLTTGGAIIANHTDEAALLLRAVGEMAKMLDTRAKADQMLLLTENHKSVEDRCQKAYAVAVEAGDALKAAVGEVTQHDMALAFVKPEHGKMGFTSSTFSFNLPAPKGASAEVTAALAQKFVDLLCVHPEFKPCVSFGQDNGLVYATVPATSTQGAIKEEDKAKQAVGGVQLVRLSFPPTCNIASVKKIIIDATTAIYAGY
jgi:cysteine synthase A